MVVVYLILVGLEKLDLCNKNINTNTNITMKINMKTLILNIDRDDDFGRKTKTESPIIGLNDNLQAANKLGQVDPEDSDLNAIFLAIKTYTKLKEKDDNVAIATICGDINVGVKSDQILVEQLEKVITQTGVTEVVLISDGAEDEYILPIVQSRLKICSVVRVTVKQSREIEDTYYRIIKMLDDDKVKKQFLLPICLILIVWAIFVLLNMTGSGFGAILLTLGMYLLIRVFNLERSIAAMWLELKSGFLTGRLSFYTTILAMVILGASVFYSYNNTDFNTELLWIVPVISFVQKMVWGIVASGMLVAFGRVTDHYVREKKIHWNYWVFPFSLFAFGFISDAALIAIYDSITNPVAFSIDPFLTIHFISFVLSGILIAIIGAVSYHYIKETYITDKQEAEIEQETAKLVQEG